jgi:integrase
MAVLKRGQNIVKNRRGVRSAPTTVNSSVRTREYLTTAEIERLMAAARKSSRYGHRDATMILVGYRHGLRASELCDLQWSQVELGTGRLHVRRAKNGSPSVHPCGATRYARCGVYSVNSGHRVTYFSLNAAGR